MECIRRSASRPVSLFSDLYTSLKNLIAKLTTVLCRPVTFESQVDRIQRIIFLGNPDGRIYNALAMLGAFRRVHCRKVRILKAPPSALDFLVHKGSITVNGVSLTVNRIDGDEFSINLIPHTLAMTTLSELEPGMAVNLETDMLARYVARLMTIQR